MKYLHSVGVVHRDIKPSNILTDPASKEVRICDFGSAVCEWDRDSHGMCAGGGSPAFMAPELFDSPSAAAFAPACDVFGLGATLFCMWSGGPPWSGRNQLAHAGNLVKLELQFPSGLEPVNPHLRHILCGMLEKEPSTRLSLGEVINHDWVTAEGSESL